jgi:hypothetical protein
MKRQPTRQREIHRSKVGCLPVGQSGLPVEFADCLTDEPNCGKVNLRSEANSSQPSSRPQRQRGAPHDEPTADPLAEDTPLGVGCLVYARVAHDAPELEVVGRVRCSR